MKAQDLGLSGIAATVALELEQAHPEVVFTSGRRSLPAQAHAMAANVERERLWIRGGTGVTATYVQSEVADACHAAVLSHPEAVTVRELATLLLMVLERYSDAELARLSLHLAGLAFDVAPESMSPEALEWLQRKTAEVGGRLLTKEGGLVRVHWQAPGEHNQAPHP